MALAATPPMQGGEKENMKLDIQERIVLLQVLPAEGDFVTLKVLRDLRGVLSFSEEDLKKFKIKTITDSEGKSSVTWNIEAGAVGAEIEVGEKATEIVKEALVKLDEEKKLGQQHFSLYEKFVQDKEVK